MNNRTKVEVPTLMLPVYHYNEDPFPRYQQTGTGRIYPYPMQDDLTGGCTERPFTAVVLDNGLLRATILPEFGGHILSMRDIRHDREVLYYNVPLKLGLIALRGAWYAGGMEFNFPQVGHTVTTIDPLPWHITEDPDGGATLFVGTVERLTRMAWTVGITLRPDDLWLHISVYLLNRTPFRNRIYFWTNTAVTARNDFRFLLPSSQVYSWWWGSKGAADFPVHNGQDLSRYTTHHRATDLFAKNLQADWFGCYYDDLDVGVLHHASRFEVHGRKLWTWGTADDGLIWADLLNDSGVPYCEIQTGRFVHQGVHRLMSPHNVESWSEAWAPVYGTGGVLHTTDSLAINAVKDDTMMTLRIFAFMQIGHATVVVQQDDRVCEDTLTLPVGEPQSLQVPLDSNSPVSVTIWDGERTLLQASLWLDGDAVRVVYDTPAPHTGVPEKTGEGTPTLQNWLLKAREHEERNESDAAADCYRKALELDSQCTSALCGLTQWHLKQGETAKGTSLAQKALEVDPQNEDALWWLGVARLLDVGEKEDQGEGISALRALERSPRYSASASALLGELILRRKDYRTALDLFIRALERNPQDSKTLALAAFTARESGDAKKAEELLERCEQVNPLEGLLWSERYFLEKTRAGERGRRKTETVEDYLEVACDYERVGAWDTVVTWIGVAKERTDWFGGTHPMLLYHTAFAMWQLGKVAEAIAAVRKASEQSPVFVFPHRHEDAQALQTALRLCPDDPPVHYLLGTYLASVGRWDEAITHWTKATQLARESRLKALAWRNIGLAQWINRRNAAEALAAYAHALDVSQPFASQVWRLWLERDNILTVTGRHTERVAMFEAAPDEVRAKLQVVTRFAEACLRAGMPERSVSLLSQGNFTPWEGEGHVRHLWKEAHMQLGHRTMEVGNFAEAQTHFEEAASFPRRFNVGKPERTDDADALFWAGWCSLKMGDKDAAHRFFEEAAHEMQPPNATTTEFKRRAYEQQK